MFLFDHTGRPVIRDCEIKINYSIYSSIFSCFFLTSPRAKTAADLRVHLLTSAHTHKVRGASGKGKTNGFPEEEEENHLSDNDEDEEGSGEEEEEECSGRSQTGAVEKENEKGAGQKAGQRHHEQKHTQGTEKVSEVGTKRGSSIDYCKNGLAFLKVSYLVRLESKKAGCISDTVYKGCHEVSRVNGCIGVCRGRILRK